MCCDRFLMASAEKEKVKSLDEGCTLKVDSEATAMLSRDARAVASAPGAA